MAFAHLVVFLLRDPGRALAARWGRIDIVALPGWVLLPAFGMRKMGLAMSIG